MSLSGTYPVPPPRTRAVPIPVVRPFWTYVLLAVNILVFLGQTAFGDSFTYYGLKINSNILAGEYWRFLTPIFFHASLLHIFFNMYALYIVGQQIEPQLGYARFLMIYLFSGVAGFYASFLFNPAAASLGASGAIFGLIGALAVFLFRHRKMLGRMGRALLSNVVFIIVLNLALSFTPGIDLSGHLGGLVCGSVLALVLGPSWNLVLDPITGAVSPVDRNPLSQRLGLAFAGILAVFLAALWLLVR
jgi:rhomboid protease GluP